MSLAAFLRLRMGLMGSDKGGGTNGVGSVWYCFWRHRPNNFDFTLPKSVDLPLLNNVDSKLLVTIVPGAGIDD